MYKNASRRRHLGTKRTVQRVCRQDQVRGRPRDAMAQGKVQGPRAHPGPRMERADQTFARVHRARRLRRQAPTRPRSDRPDRHPLGRCRHDRQWIHHARFQMRCPAKVLATKFINNPINLLLGPATFLLRLPQASTEMKDLDATDHLAAQTRDQSAEIHATAPPSVPLRIVKVKHALA